MTYDDDRVVTLLRDVDLPPAPPDRLGQVTQRARTRDTRHLSAVAAVMAVVLTAGVASAIALRGHSTTEQLTVAGAVQATQDTGSARITMHVDVTHSTNPSFPNGRIFDITGLVDFHHNAFEMKGTFDGASMGMTSTFEERVIGRDHWRKESFNVGSNSGKPWVHSMVTTSGGALADARTADPSQMLNLLTSKGTVLSRTTDGDGTKTVVRLPASELGSASPALKDARVDVTMESDSDGRIRVVTTAMDAAGLGTTVTSIRYDDFGIAVHVEPPPADQVEEAGAAAFHTGPLQTSEHFSSTVPSQQACAALKQFDQQPKPTDPGQRKAFDDLLAMMQRDCAAKK
jgi:hypothetical protein